MTLDELLDDLQQALEGRNNLIEFVSEKGDMVELCRRARHAQVVYWYRMIVRVASELEAEMERLE